MSPDRPAFVPDPALTRPEMESLQREIAAAADFADDLAVDPSTIEISAPIDPAPTTEPAEGSNGTADPVVAGVDQAFLDDRAISAVVLVRNGVVTERVHAIEPLTTPYIPGLLSFREGGPILAAFERLTTDPDVVLFDGSGRIHYRQAGLATHLGVVLDVPSVGVTKRLLCGRPAGAVEGLTEGERVPIRADGSVEAAPGSLLGFAVQTRQFSGSRRVNPVYVSPGHRVGARPAASIALACCGGYKLPEPIRLADGYAAAVREDREPAD